jgi:hypothetical protein
MMDEIVDQIKGLICDMRDADENINILSLKHWAIYCEDKVWQLLPDLQNDRIEESIMEAFWKLMEESKKSYEKALSKQKGGG